ncbi:feruloyl esterase [Caballeronia mineralivorans PML1(12)]|uniref:Feruloyl esterase n=1 Tax=Caballeronia mineralivorans PML1(12) TaxID=908627 RepID=A0A0J1CS57_9BURK|nr:feruloyl esterase [Caballeronia mineralivorans PML1(12)]
MPVLVTICASVVLLAACGGNTSSSALTAATTKPLTCDDSMKTAFKPDVNTTVTLVKAFKKGDDLNLSGTSSGVTATNDLCMVKLNVGPGNPGPAGAPSTSPGIGIEVWLPSPANWNKRVHVVGGGGWAGGVQGSTTAIAGLPNPLAALFPAVAVSTVAIAETEGAVSASTDTGHADTAGGGSFAMNPDGTINTALWTDFASRSIHEMAVDTKALATAYYGIAPKYSYWDGFSTGGRQGMKEAQANPDDFDGILAGGPAFNWSKFITGELYPQIVFQRDLGGTPLTTAQQDLVSNAAISACDSVGGQHLGYILDPSACKYDPTADRNVLCAASGGANSTPACVTPVQAAAINKIWYGITSDGSAPVPGSDNGWASVTSLTGPSGVQRWFGQTRGTSLYGAFFGGTGLAGVNGPFTVASDQVALELQNPTIAGPNFVNATGNGASGWKALSYAQLSNAFDQGIALQSQFGQINTDNPDLSAFKSHGGKLLHYHGLSDELIMPQGSVNYYTRVVNQMGGDLASVQSFYRLFLIPGFGHGSLNGTANPAANPPVPAAGQLYQVLAGWVENGVAPDKIPLQNQGGTITRPICMYPSKPTYTGGDVGAASSFTCS